MVVVALAELRDLRREGAFAKGRHRVLVHQRIAMHDVRRHPRSWRLRGVAGAKLICLECHPPAPQLDVELVEEPAE